MKTNKKHSEPKSRSRPKNVWNTLRKLEGYLRKADIQSNIFMDSLHELRDEVAFEVSADIVQKLCRTVNGDLLHALLEHRRRIEAGADGGDIGDNAMMLGILETLETCLKLTPHKLDGERFYITRDSAREYEFDVYPESLNTEAEERLEVEVLRCGWKIGTKVVIKPKVIEVIVGKMLTAV